MSIIHVNKNATLGYTILTRATLDDTRLSWKARGLLSYLLSKPDHWQVSIKHLTTQSLRDGRSAVQSALQELKRYGYAKLRTIRGAGGRVMGKRWDIYEVPEPELELPQAPAGPMPLAEPQPCTDRPKMYPSVSYRQTGFPTVGKPGRKECIEKKEYIEKEKNAHARVRDVGARAHALQDKDEDAKDTGTEETAFSAVSMSEPPAIATPVEVTPQTADDVPLHVEACALDALDPVTYQALERTARETLEAQGEPAWAIIRPMLDRTMLGLMNAGIVWHGHKTLHDGYGNRATLEAGTPANNGANLQQQEGKNVAEIPLDQPIPTHLSVLQGMSCLRQNHASGAVLTIPLDCQRPRAIKLRYHETFNDHLICLPWRRETKPTIRLCDKLWRGVSCHWLDTHDISPGWLRTGQLITVAHCGIAR